MEYDIVIGLEVHIQAKTRSKMFCRCDAKYFNTEPNTHVCPVCLGLPGALPVPNKLAIEKCVKLALALNCEINQYSKFDRKNYFYPDLPKGYQISQYDLPFGKNGYLEVDVNDDSKRMRIDRIHMEEDTGKSMHNKDETLLDFNKSGVPLIEVVTAPDFTDVREVTAYAKRLKQIVRYLDISDADMEKGQMRFELNMSLKPQGSVGLPSYKVEVKNIGSISVLEKVVLYEYERQKDILQKGDIPDQETRGLRDLTGVTYSQRKKESLNDYRYFPEADIPPILLSDEEVARIKSTIVKLPNEIKANYMKDFGIEGNLAENIILTKNKAEWFEKAILGVEDKTIINEIAKWYVGDVFALIKINKSKLSQLKFTPSDLAELVTALKTGKISGTIAKQILAIMFETGQKPNDIITEKGFAIVNDENMIIEIAKKVIEANPKVVADISKNPNASKFLLGQIMRETKGKADPRIAEQVLNKLLQI
jgi:aspartyl-tRNA(Asn)/glutamyl-tRNA(Gln) amidotransferase subunit B